MNETLDILYIAGAGRGGSTILGDVLGTLPMTTHVGELHGVFDYTHIAGSIMPCSCGHTYETCEFWGPIFDIQFGPNWPSKLQGRSIAKHLPHSYSLPLWMLYKRLRQQIPVQEELKDLLCEAAQILHEVRATTGASVIVDTSKTGPFAWLLAQQPRVNIVVIHLVREPRASMFSLTKRAIPKFDLDTGQARLDTYGLKEAFLYWIKANIGASLLRYLGLPYLRLNYETFITDPSNSVHKIVHFARQHGIAITEDPEVMADLCNKRVYLNERHLISSNPGVRSKTGYITLTEDIHWLYEISLRRKLLWTALFLPWLIDFGYKLWPTTSKVRTENIEESVK